MRTLPAMLIVAVGLVSASVPVLAQYESQNRRDYGGNDWDDRRNDWDDRRYNGDRGGWETIGRKLVSSRLDNDKLRVRGDDRYRKIRLCALDRPFELRSLSARYHNGETQRFPARDIVRAGTCTRAFDLIGHRRNIHTIYMTFVKLRRGSEPQVLVQAR